MPMRSSMNVANTSVLDRHTYDKIYKNGTCIIGADGHISIGTETLENERHGNPQPLHDHHEG